MKHRTALLLSTMFTESAFAADAAAHMKWDERNAFMKACLSKK